MTPQRWQRIESLFHEALGKPPHEREPFLRQATRRDPALFAEVVGLLQADQSASSYLEWVRRRRSAPPTSAVGWRPSLSGDERGTGPAVPRSIGPFRLMEELGRGGMGAVYLARQEQPIRREVALKLIRRSLMQREAVLRFQGERQALARMQHPNIAQVLDAGSTEDGQPFMAMEYVPGLPITQYCDERKLSILQRLSLVSQVCQGVQHLHLKGVLHRDLKPSNVLVMEVEGRPHPKIIDFGIAKSLDVPLTDEDLRTGERWIGTPAYSSPEALRMLGPEVDFDARSDLYSLGVILYELLAGELPHRGGRAPGDVREVPSPSRRLSQLDIGAQEEIASHRRLDRKSLSKALRGDLDRIALKALAHLPEDRYLSASDLAEDLNRFQRHEPVSAAPAGNAYRAFKFLRRHRLGAAASLGLLLMLVGFAAGMSLLSLRLASERDQSRQERDRNRDILNWIQSVFTVADPLSGKGETLTVREALDRAYQSSEDLEREPGLLDALGAIYRNLGLHSQALGLFERSLALRRGLGEEGLGLTQTLNDLAVVYKEMGLYEESAAHFRESLRLRRSLVGEMDAFQASALNNLATLLHDQGDFEESRRLQRQALDWRRRLLGENHAEVAESLNNLAALAYDQGNRQEAEDLIRQALQIRQSVFDPDHPAVANSLHNLALMLLEGGPNEEGEELLGRSLEIRRKRLPPGHPDLLVSLNLLASVLQDKGDYASAEPLFRQLVADRRRLHEGDHVELARALNNMAVLLSRRGRNAAAFPLFREAIDMWGRVLEENHPELGIGNVAFGMVLMDDGRLSEAERRLRRGASILKRVFPQGNWRVAAAESRLGECLLKLGRLNEAEALIVPTLAVIEEARGAEDEETRMARDRLTALRKSRPESTPSKEDGVGKR